MRNHYRFILFFILGWIIDKTYYCLIHEVPEVIYRLDTDNILTKRVRRFNWIVD